MAVGKTDKWWPEEFEEVFDFAELLWTSLPDFIVFSYGHPESTSISAS